MEKTLLYFAPHQDDELLTMGIDIARRVKQGYDVHVILCADGSKSAVRGTLGNGKTCKKHPGTHDYDLSPEAFIHARDREFTDSCLALGVAPDHIHIPADREVDGQVRTSAVEKMMLRYLEQLGKYALICTISPGNGAKQHRDHKAVGRAAENLLKQGKVRRIRLFIEPYHYEQTRQAPRMVPVEPYADQAHGEICQRIRQAVGAYQLWNPEQERYAVGYHSVTTEFDQFLSEKTARWFYKYGTDSATHLEKLRWQHRKWRKLAHQEQLCYTMDSCASPELGELQLTKIGPGEQETYRQFCREYGVTLREKDLERLADGSSYWALRLEKQVVSWGWLAWHQEFYIGETDFGFRMDKSDSAVCFDFNTAEPFRGRGYYGLLLQSIASQSPGVGRFVIYTSPDNHASDRGIRKAGFRYVGTLRFCDGSLKRFLKQLGFTEIYRKNQLFGLRIRP